MNPKFENFFKQRFNTQLAENEEQAFQSWLQAESKKLNRNIENDIIDYDLRGFWKESGGKSLSGGHLTDKFKKPNHPTFSIESMYSGAKDEDGIEYIGGTWGSNHKSFTPSLQMMKLTHRPDALSSYMNQAEKGVKLLLPQEVNKLYPNK